jgi:hypothetical protein
MSDRDKFCYLMEFNWKEVSVYLDKAWEKRTNVLYLKYVKTSSTLADLDLKIS